FRGVPYAAPPMGPLRFAAPAPPPAWRGERDATRHGPVAPQPPSRLEAVMGGFTRPQSEDCLTLTISTPRPGPGSRPVLVWLHGGAYLSGAGSLDWYDGATLSELGDLVVVGVNYRLGALGYLRVPGVSDGAAGVADVVAALRWVQVHVPEFGGDPEQVTVMGQSAGASMITYLLALPEGQGLFRRAILQSPHLGRPPLSDAQGEERGAELCTLLAVESPKRLRSTPVDRLLEATRELARRQARLGDTSPPLLPVLDELSDPDRLRAAATQGARAIPVLLGTVRQEGAAFLGGTAPPDSVIVERFREMSGGSDAGAWDRYQDRHPTGRPLDLLADLMTDRTFLDGTLDLAAALEEAWVYRFDWAPAGSPWGACHCIELPFCFGNLDDWRGSPMLGAAEVAELRGLVRAVQRAWIGFARTGDPATPDVAWPRYELPTRRVRCFGTYTATVGDPHEVCRSRC
ncbi:MAG: carboxylesterase/lipase family protein, partial [Candidatus Dormibacteraceae bacterium]